MVLFMLCDFRLKKKKKFIEPIRTEEQDEGLCWGGASRETETQVGRKEVLPLRIPVLKGQLGQPGSGVQQAMRSEPWEQRGSVPGLAQWGQGPRDPTQSSLHQQHSGAQASPRGREGFRTNE